MSEILSFRDPCCSLTDFLSPEEYVEEEEAKWRQEKHKAVRPALVKEVSLSVDALFPTGFSLTDP